MLIDGHGLAFRAFHAVPMLTSRDGTPTNVIMGFMNMLERLEREYNSRKTHAADVHGADKKETILKPVKKEEKERAKRAEHYQPSLFDEPEPEPAEQTGRKTPGVTIVFDAPGKTFRHKMYPEYKQTRKPTPPEFKPQVPLLADILKYLGYPVVMIEGVEADDTIASASLIYDALVVSSDKDLLQILRPGVEILRPVRGVSSFNHYDVETFTNEYGFPPESMPDYLALLGDTADNLPGVPGIGEKTALQLIGEYKTIENLIDNIEKLKPSHKKSLSDNIQQVHESKKLNSLKFDVELDLSLFKPSEPDYDAALSLCERLDLRQICNRIVITQNKK